MKLKDILELIGADQIVVSCDEVMDMEFEHVFATDLMSDALMMLSNTISKTILVTGLSNVQALRTAEMLDIDTVIFVRNKDISEDVIELAKENKMNIFGCKYTMYETCGILYKEGLDSPCRASV